MRKFLGFAPSLAVIACLFLMGSNYNTGTGGLVDGPSSSTDNAVVRFDGTDGKKTQDSTATIADNGDVVITGDLTLADDKLIKATNGSGTLDLRNGGVSSAVALSGDTVNFTMGWLYAEGNLANIGFGLSTDGNQNAADIEIFANAINLRTETTAGVFATRIGILEENLILGDTGVGTITLDTNTLVANGQSLVIGHTAQILASNTSEFQVLGTSGADSSIVFARFSANNKAPQFNFLKSRSATIGVNGIVLDNDVIGQFKFLPDDGADFSTQAALFYAEVDDASPAAGDIGTAFVWELMPGGGGALRDVMRLNAGGNLTLGVDITPNANRQFDLAGTFTGNTRLSITDILAASTEAQQAFIGGTINGAATFDAHGLRIAPILVEAGTDTHNNFNSLTIAPPTITAGAATLTNASSLRIQEAPTGAINNYAFWVTGATRIDGVVGSTVATIDVDGATTFVVTRNVVQLTCTGAETITTITGGLSGQILTILHEDTDCTLNDTDNDTADQLDLTGSNGDLVGAADLVLQLVYNGTHWLQISPSSQN